MDIIFNIDYKTVFGEELLLNIIKKKEDGKEQISPLRMSNEDGIHWYCRLHKEDNDGDNNITYYYSVDCAGYAKRHEWLIEPHFLEINTTKKNNITIFDHWNDIPQDSYLYSSAFTECINHRKTEHATSNSFARAITLKVRAPQLHSNHKLAIVGSSSALGEWKSSKSLPLTEHERNEWVISLDATAFETSDKEKPVEFKFICKDKNSNNSILWETCENRIIDMPDMQLGDTVVYDLDQAFFPLSDTKIAGTLVPLFSLRSKSSFGVGDFGDLKKMIDYISATDQRLLQLLPINDTTTTKTWTDSYPYSCISIFALHPQYIDLSILPKIKDSAMCKRMEELRKELNALKQIDYERVNKAKSEYMHIIYEQESAKIVRTSDFKKFIKENEWLIPYAQYSYLRDKYGTANFAEWPDNNIWDERQRKDLSETRTEQYHNIEYYLFVQYIASIQMRKVHEYARQKGVILKGDIPIGVNRYGCDVWMEPGYFNLDSQAGAPPDDFSINGQNWGFPTYNWEEMLKDGCSWWVRRFRNMAIYFDAYRIDHVLGFFRIWDIPLNSVHGLLGQFSPSLGLSREEIEAYGLQFQEELYTKPFIADWILDRIFGARASFVRDKFLVKSHDDIYDLKTEFDTQRKIEEYFKDKTSEEDTWIKDGLYALVSDVLFIRDRKDFNKFHPRITAQFNFIYEALWGNDKDVFNKIYNDYYYHRNNQFWYREAMKKLPQLIQATRMLVCAEDLGMVSDCVPWVMDELRILSLEIQSMPKDPHVRFGHLSRNPYRSVCTISSHDMPTLRQWWDENEERTQDYYNNMLYREGPAPHPLPGWLARDVVSRHLTSPSMLCILSIQDWMSIDEKLRLADSNAERINIPANPHHYWRYRMHVNIEDMMNNKDFINSIKELIRDSGRKQAVQ